MVSAHEASKYSAKGHQLLVEESAVYCVSAGVDGRHQLVLHVPGELAITLVCAPFDVRSKVQGYGGGAFCVYDGLVYFVNHADQRIYRCSRTDAPVPVTAAGALAHGDLNFDARRRRIVCVREVASETGHADTQIVSIDAADGLVRVLAQGRDFFACPRMNPSGDQLAWIAWDVPDMPWNRSALQVGLLSQDGLVSDVQDVVDRQGVSVIEPTWAVDGRLLYLSDQSGYWSLHEHGDGARALLAMSGAELGFPPYVLGMRTYCEVADRARGTSDIYALAWVDGKQVFLKSSRERDSTVEELSLPFDYLSHLCCSGSALYFLGETRRHAPTPMRYDTSERQCHVVANAAFDVASTPDSTVANVRFPTRDGGTVHAILYTPTALGEGVPPHPLVLNVHGGPTGAAFVRFDPTIDFWLARGFAWLEVNHRGSTGFGRAYREALNGRWGDLDVQDCIDAVNGLCAEGIGDPRRIVIRGASAGGYTALRALATSDQFAAAACVYGVTDLERLCATTHKFESHYLHHLVGDVQRDRDRYRARSPIHHPNAISSPVLFVQGAEDSVVPREQTLGMSALLDISGQIAPYVEFAGEGHGLAAPLNRAAALSAECLFYARVLGTPWHRDVSHPTIDGLEAYFDTKRPLGPSS